MTWPIFCPCGARFTVEIPPELLDRLPIGTFRLVATCGCGQRHLKVYEAQGVGV